MKKFLLSAITILLTCPFYPALAQEGLVKGHDFSVRIRVEKGEGDIFAIVHVKNFLEFGRTTGLEVFNIDGVVIMVEIQNGAFDQPDRVNVIPIYGFIIEPDHLILEENENGQIIIRHIPIG